MDSLFMRRIFTHSIVVLIIFSLAFPSTLFLYPKQVEAQANGNQFACAAGLVTAAAVGVLGAVFGVIGVKNNDGPGTLAEITNTNGSWTEIVMKCVLKPLAMSMVLMAIRNTGDSLVNWINGGFEGNPKFALNFKEELLDAMDQAIGGYIEGGGLSFLCDPLQQTVRFALIKQYARREPRDENLCALTDILDNVSNPRLRAQVVYGNGWDNWIRISTDPSKSPLGAFLIAQSDVAAQTTAAAEEKDKEITIGEGFLNDKKCVRDETPPEAARRLGISEAEVIQRANNGEEIFQCGEWQTTTPGSVIADKVASAIGNEDIQLAVADEMEEIINALATQAYNKIIGGAAGLLGGGGKRRPYTRQYIGANSPTAPAPSSPSSYDDIPDVWSVPQNRAGQDGDITIEDYIEWQRIRCRPETASRYPQAGTQENQRYCRTQGVAGGLVDDYTDDYVDDIGGNSSAVVAATSLVNNNMPVSASSGPNAGKAIDGVKDNPSTLGGLGASGSTDIVLWSRGDYRGTQMVRYQIVDSELPRTFSVSPNTGQDAGASSIRIPSGYRVTFFGRGSSVVLTEDTDTFSGINFNNGQGMQDWVSSIRIERSSNNTNSPSEMNPPMRTNASGSEWWQINLQNRYIISRVVIYRNTAKTVQQTLGDTLSILVSDDGVVWTTAFSQSSSALVASNNNSNVLSIAIPTTVVGQYVRIQKSGQPGFPLEFTEAEVWGKPGPALDQDTYYAANDILKQQAIDCCGYEDAGVEGYVYPTGQGGRPEGTIPLYALWSIPETNHAFTTDRAEADTWVATRGYTYVHEWKGSEAGIEAYVYPADEEQPSGTVPLYRLWSPIGTDHFFTTSQTIKNRMISLGYVDEGIEAFVYPTQREGTFPFYKLQRGTY